MSVKKYDLAKEFRKGAAARILNQAQDFSMCSEAFMNGWMWAGKQAMGLLYDELNIYLESVGEEKIQMMVEVEVMREKKESK